MQGCGSRDLVLVSRPIKTTFLRSCLGLGLDPAGLGLGLGLGLSGLGLVLVSDSLVLITSLIICNSILQRRQMLPARQPAFLRVYVSYYQVICYIQYYYYDEGRVIGTYINGCDMLPAVPLLARASQRQWNLQEVAVLGSLRLLKFHSRYLRPRKLLRLDSVHDVHWSAKPGTEKMTNSFFT